MGCVCCCNENPEEEKLLSKTSDGKRAVSKSKGRSSAGSKDYEFVAPKIEHRPSLDDWLHGLTPTPEQPSAMDAVKEQKVRPSIAYGDETLAPGTLQEMYRTKN